MSVADADTSANGSSPSSRNGEKGAGAVAETISRGEENEPVPHLHAKTYLAVFTVTVIYYAQLVNLVGAGAQTQTIASALGGSGQSVWISSPMVIMTVVLGPIVSQAADYWGRRPFLIGLTALGAVGCIIVSRANSMGMAIAGFTVTGFSYGAQPLLHAVASEVLPRRYRSWAQAADLVASGLGGITALLVGGALNRQSNPMSESFRTFWYMTTGIFVLATILTVFFYNPPPRETQASLSFSEKLGRLDWVGYALLTGGLVLFCIGLSWSDNPYPWSDPHTSATFAVGMALVLALCLYEAFVKKDGMFHHGLFAERNFAIALACVFCEGVAFFAANQYFAFEVGVLYEQDNLRVGIRYSIPLIVSIFSALGGGLYCAVTKRVRWVTVVAFSVFTGFFIGMATSGPTDSTKVWGFTILLGTGLGLSLCVLITVAQLSTPPELIAIASGILISVRSLGGAVGLAVYNALFVAKMNHLGDNIAAVVVPLGLSPQDLGAFIGALTSRNDAALFQIPGVTAPMVGAAAGALLETYSSAFRSVWIAASCFVGLAGILAVFLKDPRHEFNMVIDSPVEEKDRLYSKAT